MKKKVLFVFHDSNPLSGATASMLEVVLSLKKRDEFDISVLIPNTRLGVHEVLENFDIKYFESKYYNVRHSISKKLLIIKKLNVLFKILNNIYTAIKFSLGKEKFDLVYTNTSDIYVGAFISLLMHKKHIWHIREFGIEDQNASHLLGEKFFLRFVNYASNKVIVISEALKKKMINYNVNSDKLYMIYNDVSKAKEKTCRVINSDKKLSLLIVGTISEGKGHEFVLRCISYMKSKGLLVKLGIVGKDKQVQYADYLKDITKKNKCEDCVQFLGYRSDVNKIRQSYDVAIVSSKSEAFGRVTVEAMHSKMVVVASASGANPELIKHNVNGFLFNPDDVDNFTEIISYIDKNRSLLENIGNNAYESANKFSCQNAAIEINNLINNTFN